MKGGGGIKGLFTSRNMATFAMVSILARSVTREIPSHAQSIHIGISKVESGLCSHNNVLGICFV